MTRTRWAGCAVLAMATSAGAAWAQGTPGPWSTTVKSGWGGLKKNLAASATLMGDADYAFKAAPTVRTFGQLIGHLANYNYLWCSQAKGDKNPAAGQDFEKLTNKAALVKSVTEAISYCAAVYEALTDASGQELLTITQENGRRSQSHRISLLTLNYGHNNEHYGNVVTYMRMKDIVPPSSEPR